MSVAKKKETEGGSEDEFSFTTWRAAFLEALPVLEWVAARGTQAGAETQDVARRLIIRHYIAATRRPGLAKTRLLPS